MRKGHLDLARGRVWPSQKRQFLEEIRLQQGSSGPAEGQAPAGRAVLRPRPFSLSLYNCLSCICGPVRGGCHGDTSERPHVEGTAGVLSWQLAYSLVFSQLQTQAAGHFAKSQP